MDVVPYFILQLFIHGHPETILVTALTALSNGTKDLPWKVVKKEYYIREYKTNKIVWLRFKTRHLS